MDNEKFTYTEMQEHLPDYVFGRLSPEECQRFESTLPDYPDLQKEVVEVRNVFQKLESMNLDNYVERKTKNIPVKVSARLQQRRQPLAFLSSHSFRTAVAGAGLLIIIFSLIFFPKKQDTFDTVPQKSHNQLAEQRKDLEPLFKIEGMEELVSSLPKDNDLANQLSGGSLGIPESLSQSPEIAVTLDSLMKETLISSINTDTQISIDIMSYSQLLDNLNNLDESDFIELIKEIENVNI
jgi:hypothetical protein